MSRIIFPYPYLLFYRRDRRDENKTTRRRRVTGVSGLVPKRLRGLPQLKVRPPPYLKSSTSTLCTSRFATNLLQQTTYPAHSATLLTYHQTANMKPVVSALNAWSWYAPPSQTASIESPIALTPCSLYSVVISAFAIIILSVLGSLYSVRLPDSDLPTKPSKDPLSQTYVIWGLPANARILIIEQQPRIHRIKRRTRRWPRSRRLHLHRCDRLRCTSCPLSKRCMRKGIGY